MYKKFIACRKVLKCINLETSVCVELTSGAGTLFNCTTNTAIGSKTCTVYCEDGKVLPSGLIDQHSYTCGPNTNYEWDYMENIPSCVGKL